MVFLAPAFLIGLVALAVPVAIHLWSKNTQSSRPFGSIRFLAETETKTMRSLMPSQWLLLLSRLLVLTCLVLILSESFWNGREQQNDTLYLIDPVYNETSIMEAIEDTISTDTEIRWLADGFPFHGEQPGQTGSDYWSLLSKPPREARNIIVVSPLLVKNFGSKRKAFPSNYSWVKLPVTPEEREVFTYQKGEEVFSINSIADEWSTSCSTGKGEVADALRLSYYIESQEEFDSYQELFEAALAVVNSLSPLTLEQSDSNENADWLIWLSSETPPSRKNIILVNENTVAKWTEIADGVIRISSNWDSEDAIQLDLPQKLLVAFAEGLVDTAVADRRTMDVQSFSYLPAQTGGEGEKLGRKISELWFGLILLLLLERWLAFKSEAS